MCRPCFRDGPQESSWLRGRSAPPWLRTTDDKLYFRHAFVDADDVHFIRVLLKFKRVESRQNRVRSSKVAVSHDIFLDRITRQNPSPDLAKTLYPTHLSSNNHPPCHTKALSHSYREISKSTPVADVQGTILSANRGLLFIGLFPESVQASIRCEMALLSNLHSWIGVPSTVFRARPLSSKLSQTIAIHPPTTMTLARNPDFHPIFASGTECKQEKCEEEEEWLYCWCKSCIWFKVSCAFYLLYNLCLQYLAFCKVSLVAGSSLTLMSWLCAQITCRMSTFWLRTVPQYLSR